MRILVVGAGAIGTYLGVSLSTTGVSISYLEDSEAAKRVSNLPFIVQSQREEIRQETPVIYTSFAQAFNNQNYDVILLAVKAFHISNVIRDLKPFKSHFLALASVQNGVETEPALKKAFPDKQIIAISLTTAVTRMSPGIVRPEIVRGIGVDVTCPIGYNLFELINRTDLRPKPVNKPRAMKWSKMVTNIFANASSAILDLPPSAIYADNRLFKIEREQVVEAIKVMKAEKITLIDLPGIPVRLLVFLFTNIPLGVSQFLLSRILGSGRGEKMPSFHIDLSGGNKENEVEYLNGAICRKAVDNKIHAPVNQVLWDTLMNIVRGDIAWKTYQKNPEMLIREINKEKSKKYSN